MTDDSSKEPSANPIVSRRIFLGSIALLGGAAIAYGVSRAGFRLWMQNTVPDDAPRIGFSLDDAWLTCNGGAFATCDGEADVDVAVVGDPWAAGESALSFWVTDDATGAQALATITHP